MSAPNWPFTGQPVPEVVSAQGNMLRLKDGRQVLDAAGGAIVNNIGHGREAVARAVYEATRDCTYVVPPWTTPGRTALVAALEQDWLPGDLDRIHITTGGSDAVESAIKLALQYHAATGAPERTEIVTRDPSYHGTTLATGTWSGHPARKRGLAQAMRDNPKAPAPYPLRCPLGADHPDMAQHYVDALAAVIDATGPERIAALLVEPITGSSGGALVPPDGYWQAVQKLCRKHGILLVCDEVMTGFGRTGRDFAFQHFGLAPDIVVAGKGLAGGYAPLGGVFARRPIGEAIRDAGYAVMFHTFGAHPAACSAGAAVLKILREEQLVERAARVGETFLAALAARFAEHPQVAEVRGRGMLLAIEVVADRATLARFPEAVDMTGRIVREGLDRGVFFYAGGTGAQRDILCLGPALNTSEAELAQMGDVLLAAVDAAVAGVPTGA